MSEWPMVKLGEVCSISIGKTPARKEPRYWGEGLPWLSIKDMNQGSLILKTTESISQIALDELKITPYPVGTVLFSFKLSIGKVGITAAPLFTNEAIAAIEPKEQEVLNKYYLMEVLREAGKTVEGNAAVMGVTLNKKSLAKLTIPLPPLGEQKRIAEILGKVSKAIQQVEGQLERTQELSLSVVDNFVKSELVDTQPLYELVEFRGGSTPSKKNDDFWDDGNIRWFTSKDLKLNELVDSIDHVTESAIKNTALKPVSNIKAIAISLRGMSLAHRVPMSVIPANSCVNQDLKALIPKAEMDVSVIFALLKREEAYLLTKVTTSAHGTKKLDFPHVKNLQIPKLSSVQISKIKLQLEHINQLDYLLHRKLSLLQELQKSLANRAFAGLL